MKVFAQVAHMYTNKKVYVWNNTGVPLFNLICGSWWIQRKQYGVRLSEFISFFFLQMMNMNRPVFLCSTLVTSKCVQCLSVFWTTQLSQDWVSVWSLIHKKASFFFFQGEYTRAIDHMKKTFRAGQTLSGGPERSKWDGFWGRCVSGYINDVPACLSCLLLFYCEYYSIAQQKVDEHFPKMEKCLQRAADTC